MYSSCKLQFDLSEGFLPRLLGAYLPAKTLFEGKSAPRSPWFYLLSTQAQQHQIGHDGHSHRTLHPCGVLGDLRVAQAHDSFQFLDAEFHRPSSEIDRHGHVCARLRQIGHEQFGLFGAPAPPPTKYDCTISYRAQLRI
jgi:hypothetical protein